MRIAVFGSTGRTGRSVVEQGLSRGHDLVAFVRDPSRLTTRHERLRSVQGDAREPESVDRALSGVDGVISVLALVSPFQEPELSDATRAVIDAVARAGLRRIVVTANNDVFSDREVTGEFAAHAREHRRNRAALQESGLDWTIGAAPWVTDDRPTGVYEAVVDARAPGKRLAAADFATFTLDALERDEWIEHIIGVSAPPTERSRA